MHFLLISGGFGTIFLIKLDSNEKFLFMRKFFFENVNIVKSPVIFDDLVFALTTKGMFYFEYNIKF